MDYRIAVVDDTRSDREKLASDIAAWFRGKREVEVNAFPNAESMLRSFIPGRYRIAFIDIIMPEENGASRGENGIALATRLKAMDSKLLVIFYTTSREYVFDAFSIHPFDYLVKPYDRRAVFPRRDRSGDIRPRRPEHRLPSAVPDHVGVLPGPFGGGGNSGGRETAHEHDVLGF